jgi:hypothetical protein
MLVRGPPQGGLRRSAFLVALAPSAPATRLEVLVLPASDENHFLRRLVSTFLSPLAAGYLIVVALLWAPRRRAALALGAIAFAGLLFTFSRSSLALEEHGGRRVTFIPEGHPRFPDPPPWSAKSK